MLMKYTVAASPSTSYRAGCRLHVTGRCLSAPARPHEDADVAPDCRAAADPMTATVTYTDRRTPPDSSRSACRLDGKVGISA